MDVGQWLLDARKEYDEYIRRRRIEEDALLTLKIEAEKDPTYVLNEARHRGRRMPPGVFEDKWLHFTRLGWAPDPTGDYGLNNFCLAEWFRSLQWR
jgi:hypothetical protein